MARLPRYALPGQPQHVIQRGNNRSTLFQVPGDYAFFRDCLASAIDRFPCHVHAYVFMTNHVHLVMTPVDDGSIGRVMQSVGRRYVRYFNDRYERTGTLFEGRYRAALIDSESYLFTCHRYVELNPVRAGITRIPDEYLWSSYRANALGHEDALVTPHGLYVALGSDPTAQRLAYRGLFRPVVDDASVAAIRDATHGGWLLSKRGSSCVERRLNRRERPRSRGGSRRGAGRPCGVNSMESDPIDLPLRRP